MDTLLKVGSGAVDPYAVMPTVTGSLLWLSSGKSLFSDAGGTTPAVVDGAGIARWDPVSAAWGLGTYSFRQATAGNKPTLKSNGVQSDGGDFMTLASGTISLSGDFTVWLAYLINDKAVDTIVPITKQGAGAYFHSIIGNLAATQTCYAMAAAAYSEWAANGTAALRIQRFRRSASTVRMKTFGVAEAIMVGLGTDTITLDALLQRGGDNVVNTTSGSRLREIVVAEANYDDASAGNIAVIAKLQELVAGVQW